MSTKEQLIEEEWNIYWANKNKPANYFYDKISWFYRKYIIRKILNHFTKKHFMPGQDVLHAGCGSGQVDTDLVNYINITALDISPNALIIYKQIHNDKARIVQGDIFHLPFDNEQFDGIYNLGVMEHFTQEEINSILLEFKRVLKLKGKMVILWPPKFGLTVFALDSIHFVMNKILRQNIKLHPDEISRVKSKAYALRTFQDAGFNVIEYYFGVMDFFTQAVIVCEKADAKA